VRGACVAAEFLADGEPVQARELQVEQDQVRQVGAGQAQGGLTTAGRQDATAKRAQSGGDSAVFVRGQRHEDLSTCK